MKPCDRCKQQMLDTERYPYPICPPCILIEAIFDHVQPHHRVIDAGCGMGTYAPELFAWLQSGELVLLDAHEAYLANIRLDRLTLERRRRLSKVAGVLPDALRAYGDKAFDVALALDVPEHLAPNEAEWLVREMQRIARKVCLFVPEGKHPQTKDAYELGGDHWQTHRSEWYCRLSDEDRSHIDAELHLFHPGTYGMENSAYVLRGWDVKRWSKFHALNPVEGRSDSALFCSWPSVRAEVVAHHPV